MIYFVTIPFIKLNTPVTNNVDTTDIESLVKTAADTFVRSILGTFFYDDLLTKYNAQTLNPQEVTLVQDYIQMAVAWRVCAESIMTLSLQLKNKGLQSQSGDFSAAADKSSMAFMFHHYRDRADFYDQRLMDYLIENGDLYPAFINLLNVDSIVPGWPNCKGHNGNTMYSGITFI